MDLTEICENTTKGREHALLGTYDSAMVYYQGVIQQIQKRCERLTDPALKVKWQQATYCENQLKPHQVLPGSWELREKICSQHHRLMAMYRHTDKSFICYSCTTTDEHRAQDSSSPKIEVTEKQNGLKEEQRKSQQRIQEKQKKLQEVKKTVDIIKTRAQAAVDESERIFTEMISSMEKKRSEVTELIRTQEEAELSRTERLLGRLEREIADLQRRVTELEQLSHTDDHIHFLQRFSSLCVPPGCDDSPRFTINQHPSFDGMRKSVSDLKKQAEQIDRDVQLILPTDLKSREDILQYFCYLSLDPNTAHHQLIVSEKDTLVTCCDTEEQHSEHPERFDSWEQVLCKQSVRGRCYWEVEWSSESWVDISVSYKEIRRKGKGHACGFGRNNQSWSLQCSSSSVSFWHDDIKTVLKGPVSSRIGVYVDHRAGILAFYSISDTMRLLHSIHTTFAQPLHAGFYLWQCDATTRLCDPKLDVYNMCEM